MKITVRSLRSIIREGLYRDNTVEIVERIIAIGDDVGKRLEAAWDSPGRDDAIDAIVSLAVEDGLTLDRLLSIADHWNRVASPQTRATARRNVSDPSRYPRREPSYETDADRHRRESDEEEIERRRAAERGEDVPWI